MKITIDTIKQTIELEEEVKISDFVTWLKEHINDYKRYKIIPVNRSPFYYCPYTTTTYNTQPTCGTDLTISHLTNATTNTTSDG